MRAESLAVTCYAGIYPGRPEQLHHVRRAVARHLAGCPAADDAILVLSEFAANAIVHSASRGQFFTVRAEVFPGYVWVEAEDLGGPWRRGQADDRPHGLDVVEALTGPGGWGVEITTGGGRVVWARLDLPPAE
jgi:anti-sigma regulatory factor (Ser/Thr protein kinase)